MSLEYFFLLSNSSYNNVLRCSSPIHHWTIVKISPWIDVILCKMTRYRKAERRFRS